MPQRLVALDIDGTLIGYDGHLSERVRSAVRRVDEAGHHVVIATGRSVYGTTDLISRLELTRGYAVCSNGAITVALNPQAERGYDVVHTVTFDPGPAVRLLERHLPEALFAVEVTDHGGVLINAPWPEGELISPVIDIVPMDEMLASHTTRVVVRSPNHTSKEFLDLAHSVGLHGVTFAVGYTAWLDLAPDGVTKASALERLRPWLNVAPADTVAVGDGANDVEMVAWAHRGVAMGNAADELKAVADEIVPAVDEDGLLVVLESL